MEEMMTEYPFVERIALEQYNYVEVKANSVEDLVKRATELKTRYADRLFKPQAPVAPAPYQSSTPFPQGMQMQESGMTCGTCNAVMVYREGVTKSGKNAGKQWRAYMCPNSKVGTPGHEPKWLK